jgi:hypothetical protein
MTSSVCQIFEQIFCYIRVYYVALTWVRDGFKVHHSTLGDWPVALLFPTRNSPALAAAFKLLISPTRYALMKRQAQFGLNPLTANRSCEYRHSLPSWPILQMPPNERAVVFSFSMNSAMCILFAAEVSWCLTTSASKHRIFFFLCAEASRRAATPWQLRIDPDKLENII